MGLLGLLQGHAKPLIERHFLALAGIVTTFYPYLEATPFSEFAADQPTGGCIPGGAPVWADPPHPDRVR